MVQVFGRIIYVRHISNFFAPSTSPEHVLCAMFLMSLALQ